MTKGPEKQLETPIYGEPEALQMIQEATKGTFRLDNKLLEDLIGKATSDKESDRISFEENLYTMERGADTMKAVHQSPKARRILSLLSAKERKICTTPIFRLSKENFKAVTEEVFWTGAKFEQYVQIVFDESSRPDTLVSVFMAKPEEIAGYTSKMSTKDSVDFMDLYRQTIYRIAEYTKAGIIPLNEAHLLAKKATANPEEINKILRERKKEFENKQHDSADKIFDEEINR